MKSAGNRILLTSAIFIIAVFVFLLPAVTQLTPINADNSIMANGPDGMAAGPDSTAMGPDSTATGPNYDSSNDNSSANINNNNSDSNATTTSACYDPCKKDPYYYWENAQKHWVTSCPVCNLNDGINDDLENTGGSQVVEGLGQYLNPNGTTQYSSTEPQFPNFDNSVTPSDTSTGTGPNSNDFSTATTQSNNEATTGNNNSSEINSSETDGYHQEQTYVPCAGRKCKNHNYNRLDNGSNGNGSEENPNQRSIFYA